MGRLTRFIDERFYPDCRGNWDDTLFRDRILECLEKSHRVLDVGAGAGIIKQMNFKDEASCVCGIDVDPRVLENPFLDEAHVCDATSIPYRDATFDIAFADNVLEHLADPKATFKEIARILKPGGLFLFKTPNKWHYVPTIARISPHKFHERINRWRGRQSIDVFPTLYRANTLADISRIAAGAGLEVVSLERIERRPEYLRLSGPTYLAGLAYERLVNSTSLLAGFRVLLVGKIAKAVSTTAGAR